MASSSEESASEELSSEESSSEDRGLDAEAGVEKRRLAQEKKNERLVWWSLAYFLFGIHIVAFVMIFAVMHAK